MSAPTKPTTVLIRDSARPPASRKRKVAIIVALLVGLPGLALAAGFLFTQITGQTILNSANQDMRIASVVGTKGPEGVDCTGSSKTSNTEVRLVPATQSLRITSDGVPNGPVQVTTGTCTVDVLVENNGPADVKVTSNTTMPTGWTIAAPVLPVPKESQAHLIATITASPTATAGAITGSLALELVPAA